MKIVKLAEVVKELESGTRPKGGVSSETGTIPSLGAEHLSEDGRFNFHKNKFITTEFFNSLKSGKIKYNDILIVKDGATTGKVAFVKNDFPFTKAAINEHVFRIAIDKQIGFSKYVYFFLRSLGGKKQILNDFRGATVGGISRQFIESTKIPLPPLEDQIRIAAVLTRTEKLIAKRKEGIKALNELLKSTFMDMFGDPVMNKKRWDVKTAIDYAGCIVPGRDKPKSFSVGTPWVTTNDLVHLGFTEKSKSDIGLSDDEIKEVRARVIPQGSVIITCVGDLGVATLARVNMVVNQQLHAFQCHNSINNIFFMHAISFQKAFMYKRATKTTVPYMNKTVCNSIPMICPPLTLQNQFASIVEKVESLKIKYTQSLTELENLYGTVSQRAFKGKLDLSKVPVEEVNQ